MPYEKVGKNEPVCIADEVPFDIPDSWEWCRIGSILQINPRNIVSDETTAGFIPMSLLQGGFENNHSFETKQWETIKKGFTHFADNDIVVAKITPCFQNRKSAVIRGLPNGVGAGTTELHVLRDATNKLHMPYFLLLCKTNDFIVTGVKSFTGTAGQQRISKDFINQYLIPIPPYNEQIRITECYSSLMPLVNDYEKLEDDLVKLNNTFPELLKKSILQEAVQGKLVPQNPYDEPASILLEKIRKEKQWLIKEGKIKKDKNESIIFTRDNSHYEKLGNIERCIDDEIPFEIPESWAYIRLSELVVKDIKRGKSPKYISNSNIKVFAQKCNTKAGYINLDLAKSLDESIVAKYPDSEYLLDNDIVINSTGTGTMGRVGIFKDSCNPNNYPVVPDSHVTTIRLIDLVNEKYIFYVLKQYQKWLEEQGEGSTNQKELRPDTIKNLLIPLPATKEQQRIVNSIEQALSLIS